MFHTRRTFLATLGAAALGSRLPVDQLLGRRSIERAAKIGKIGIQLYSVRKQAAADLPGTLAQLGKIGYKEVELAGYYNHTAAEFRELLDQNGVVAPSGHIDINLIETQTEKTFADAHTMGHEWITVPSLPRGKRETADDWKRVAAQFNSAASKAKAAGFRFAFHNHNDIVKRTGDLLPIDVLMKETDPSLVWFELDIYWAVNGGADPVDLLTGYRGRFSMLHVKDGVPTGPSATMTDVGAGTIDFKTIFARAQAAGAKIEHYFVESDSAQDPFAFAANSYRYLSKLEF